MSKVVTCYATENISGDGTGWNTVQPTTTPVFTLTNSPAYRATQPIGSGNNLVLVPAVPSNAQFCLISPATNNAASLYIMAASGDSVGFQISSTLPSRIAISPAMTSFIIRSTGSCNLDLFFA